MNAILTIAALIAAVTVHDIVQVVANHIKAKDALKLVTARKEAAEASLRTVEAQKSADEIEKLKCEAKLELAEKLENLNTEQLAAYQHSLDNLTRPVTQYVQVPFIPYQPFPPFQPWR